MVLENRHTREDLAIVLGGGINSDGTLPSHVISRLDETAEMQRSGDSDLILVSGGGKGQVITTEAQLGKRYLVGTHGIDPGVILTENHSANTLGNAVGSRRVIERYGLEPRIKLVTGYFHADRSEKAFEAALEDNPYPINVHAVDDASADQEQLEARKGIEAALTDAFDYLVYRNLRPDDLGTFLDLYQLDPETDADKISEVERNYLGTTPFSNVLGVANDYRSFLKDLHKYESRPALY